LTRFVEDGYPRPGLHGGGPIPDAAHMHDFKRLEEVVTALVDKYRRAQAQVAGLRRDLAERDRRLRGQEQAIRELNQGRQDVAKRLDQLIGELDRLDAELGESATRGS